MHRRLTSGWPILAVLLVASLVVLDAQRGGGGGARGGGGGAGAGGGRIGGRGPIGQPPQVPDDRRRPEEQEPPTFRDSVTIVQIDALVTDSEGRPVTDLSVDDFEILEGGARRDITTFAAVNIPPPQPVPVASVEADVATNTAPPGRTYLIALDEMAPERALRTRAMLRQFIEQHFGAGDRAAVALTGRGLSTSGQDFTSNKRLLLQAIDKFSGGFESPEGSGPLSSSGRQLASSLRQLTEFLATMPGRKVMLFFGEGLGGLDVFAAKDYRGGALTPAELDAHEAIAAATRGNVTIYPIDPRGLTTDTTAAESFDTSNLDARADLAAIADVTGGFSLVGSNNVNTALQRIVAENGAYYTIGFASESSRADGRFIPVQVRVRRPGLTVRSRDGYIAPLGRGRAAPIAAEARNPTVAAAIGSAVPVNDVPMRVVASSYRGSGKNALVALVIEFDVSRLDLVEKNGTLSGELEISYLATDAKGKVRPGRRHSAVATMKNTADGDGRQWARAISEFELPEGRYQLRIAAGGAFRAGSVVADLAVPDYGDQPIVLSHVSLTSTRAPELLTLRLRDPLGTSLPGPPTAARDFSPGDALALYVEAYRNGRGTPVPTVTVDLRDASGATVVRQAADQRTRPPLRSGANGVGVMSVVQLADLASGTYVLRVEARGNADQTAVRTIPIRIR